MFSPIICTFLLAICSQAFANNSSPVAYSVTSSTYSEGVTYATASAISTSSAPPTVTGTYTTSFSVPIYSCVYYVNATSAGIYTSMTTGRPQHNISSSYYPIGNITSTVTSAAPMYTTTYDSASPAFNGTFSISSYAPPRSVSYSISSAPVQASSSAYSFRPLTSTVYATLYTANGTTSTVYGAPTVTSSLIGYPSGGLPPCSPYSGGGTASSSTTADPSGSALQANSDTNDNKPSTGFAINHSFAGVTLGAVAGIALVFL